MICIYNKSYCWKCIYQLSDSEFEHSPAPPNRLNKGTFSFLMNIKIYGVVHRWAVAGSTVSCCITACDSMLHYSPSDQTPSNEAETATKRNTKFQHDTPQGGDPPVRM